VYSTYKDVKERTVTINYSLTYLLGGESAWNGAEQHKGCGCKELRFHVVVGTWRDDMLFVLIQNQNYDFSLHVK